MSLAHHEVTGVMAVVTMLTICKLAPDSTQQRVNHA